MDQPGRDLDKDVDLPFEDVKALVFPTVDMERRAEACRSQLIEEGNVAVSVSRTGLPGHQGADKPRRVALALV